MGKFRKPLLRKGLAQGIIEPLEPIEEKTRQRRCVHPYLSTRLTPDCKPLMCQPSRHMEDLEMNQTQTITADIDAPLEAVISELANPMSHPSWATAFFEGEAEAVTDSEVRVTVPLMGGPCRMRIDADVDHGIIDIFLASGEAEYGEPLPVRVVRNGEGATVLWTLSRFPGMPESAFSAGCASMQEELSNLKAKMESTS